MAGAFRHQLIAVFSTSLVADPTLTNALFSAGG
jgi:hypothetical protein